MYGNSASGLPWPCQARHPWQANNSIPVPGIIMQLTASPTHPTLLPRPLHSSAPIPSASQVVSERDDVRHPFNLQARRYGAVHDDVNRHGIVRVVLPYVLLGVALVEVGADERRGVNVLPQTCRDRWRTGN